MSRRTRILIAEPDGFSRAALTALSEKAEVVMETWPPGRLGEAFASFDAVWIRLGHRIDRSVLASGHRCRVVAAAVTGLDHVDLKACDEAGVRVVSLRGEVAFLQNVRATAELSVALALALLRRLPAAAADVRGGTWRRDLFRGHELFRRTVGIVGVGRLGSIVSSYFQAFGCHVLGYDIRPDVPATVDRCRSLPELLGRSDLVSVHVAYDTSTHHLLGADAFRAMKPGAHLVNTSRGGVIDEAALLEALERGHLAGAALDVVSGEPHVDARHPVIAYAATHDNLLVVPHIGGNTFESVEATECFIAGRLLEALRDTAPARQER